MVDKSQPRIRAADAAGIAHAAQVLRAGGLVALPTETVYGLAARADSDGAVAAIYRAKGRPDFNPLIVHVADVAQAEHLAQLDERARRVADAFWPGPLTLVLPKRADAALAPAVTAGLPTVALRCPAHPAMRALLHETGLPLAAPSANRSGAVSPTTAEHVAASLVGGDTLLPSPAGRGRGWGSEGQRPSVPASAEPPPQPLPKGEGLKEVGSSAQGLTLILDGGPCATGIESTILALRENGGWQILRPGPVTHAQISTVLGGKGDVVTSKGIEAPGQLASHYAPGKPMRLDAATAEVDEFHIGFGAVAGDFNLSASSDSAEAASRLYTALHLAAGSPKPMIAVAPVPGEDIAEAIRDRLRRAAA